MDVDVLGEAQARAAIALSGDIVLAGHQPPGSGNERASIS